MRYNEIQDLIKLVSKSGVNEVSLETDKIKLTIKSELDGKKGKRTTVEEIPVQQVIQQPQVVQAAPMAAPAPVAAAPAAPAAPVADDSNYITIKSPMIGTAAPTKTGSLIIRGRRSLISWSQNKKRSLIRFVTFCQQQLQM